MSYQEAKAYVKRMKLLSGYKPHSKPGQSLGAPGRSDNTSHNALPRPDVGEGTLRMSRGPQ